MTNKEALEELVYYSTLDDSGFEPIMKDYAKIIENELKVLEIIKKYFYLKFNTYEWGNYITIVGKEDWDIHDGIDAIASSDFLEDKDIEFLKKYFEGE